MLVERGETFLLGSRTGSRTEHGAAFALTPWSRSQDPTASVLALPSPRMALGKGPYDSKPQFPHLCNGDNK